MLDKAGLYSLRSLSCIIDSPKHYRTPANQLVKLTERPVSVRSELLTSIVTFNIKVTGNNDLVDKKKKPHIYAVFVQSLD